jgi:CBS-domain-containing membrane protein
MGITKTVHPPAGATALLAATDPGISRMGWFLLPFVLLCSILMLCCALVVNNIQRQFPMYWWTPVDLKEATHTNCISMEDVEKAGSVASKR